MFWCRVVEWFLSDRKTFHCPHNERKTSPTVYFLFFVFSEKTSQSTPNHFIWETLKRCAPLSSVSLFRWVTAAIWFGNGEHYCSATYWTALYTFKAMLMRKKKKKKRFGWLYWRVSKRLFTVLTVTILISFSLGRLLHNMKYGISLANHVFKW